MQDDIKVYEIPEAGVVEPFQLDSPNVYYFTHEEGEGPEEVSDLLLSAGIWVLENGKRINGINIGYPAYGKGVTLNLMVVPDV